MLLIYSDICVLMNYIFYIYLFWLIQHVVNCCNFAAEIISIINRKCKMEKTLLMLFAAFCAAQTMFALTIGCRTQNQTHDGTIPEYINGRCYR